MTAKPQNTPAGHAAETQDLHEARAGSRGVASGKNIEQNRAVGQDDPMDGSRMGREQHKSTGYPGAGDPGDGEGTNPAQESERKNEGP